MPTETNPTVAHVQTRLCLTCNLPISLARRKAVPSATRCVECQQQNDVKIAREAPVDMSRLRFGSSKPESTSSRRHTSFITRGLASVMKREERYK